MPTSATSLNNEESIYGMSKHKKAECLWGIKVSNDVALENLGLPPDATG